MMSADAGALLSELKTGDLVLFTGHGLGLRPCCRWLGRSDWTHVGLVLRGPTDAEPRLWEADREGPRRGTRVARLAVRMAGFRGRMSARCLNRRGRVRSAGVWKPCSGRWPSVPGRRVCSI